MEKKFDLVGFGEAMVRFSPLNHARLEQVNSFSLAIAAAELNVAVNTSRLGLKTAYVSKLVDTWSAHYIINKGREHGVDMSGVKLIPFDGRGNIRNGLCFVEVGIGPRPNRQIYDRGHSAISGAKVDEFDWDNILSQTNWYHTTGITTALSDEAIEQVIVSLKTAKKLGVKTSFDLNFRSTLWKPDKAQNVMKDVIPYVDVLIGNEEDFEKMLGLKAKVAKGYSKIDPTSYRSVAEKAVELYPNIEVVGTTLRDAKTGLLNDWQTVMLYKGVFFVSRKYENLEIVDRTGGGDSFASALIYNILKEKNPQETIEFSAAYSALCHGFLGDFFVSRKYENLEIIDRTGGGDSFASALIYNILKEKNPQETIEFSAAYSALCHGFLGDWNWAYKEEVERVMKGASVRVVR